MKVVTAPERLEPGTEGEGRWLFLAGGITDCPDWQAEVIDALSDTALVILNPRRPVFPPRDAPDDLVKEQIRWEYAHLRLADAILFWFPCETLCPIVLYELGAWTRSVIPGKPIFVGVHPEYERRRDVEMQTGLERPGLEIVYNLADLAEQVRTWELAP